MIVDKPERTQTQILIGCLGSHTRDEDHVALLVANTIFGGTFTARMTQEVRSKRGWSYGAYSSMPIDRRRQSFSMWTFPKADDAGPCLKLELDMLHDLREKGVTKAELSWAKRYMVRSHCFAIDTAAKRVGLELDQTLYDLPEDYYSRYTERVQAVTLEQANLAASKAAIRRRSVDHRGRHRVGDRQLGARGREQSGLDRSRRVRQRRLRGTRDPAARLGVA